MKQLGIILPVLLLLLGVGITSGLAAAELNARQDVQPSATKVGMTANVVVNLEMIGDESSQVTVVPDLPAGVSTNYNGGQTATLTPGRQALISYPIMAAEIGNFWIASQIYYTESGAQRELRMESPFTVIGSSTQPGSSPGPEIPGSVPPASEPSGSVPVIGTPPDVDIPGVSAPGSDANASPLGTSGPSVSGPSIDVPPDGGAPPQTPETPTNAQGGQPAG